MHNLLSVSTVARLSSGGRRIHHATTGGVVEVDVAKPHRINVSLGGRDLHWVDVLLERVIFMAK